MVIYGKNHIDRSFWGTGAAAKMTLLYPKAEHGPHQPFINMGPVESTFKDRLVKETLIGKNRPGTADIRDRAF